MNTINDGGAAYPHTHSDRDGDTGLTKREWFAGMALQGLVASGYGATSPVEEAVCLADALLRALSYTRVAQEEES